MGTGDRLLHGPERLQGGSVGVYVRISGSPTHCALPSQCVILRIANERCDSGLVPAHLSCGTYCVVSTQSNPAANTSERIPARPPLRNAPARRVGATTRSSDSRPAEIRGPVGLRHCGTMLIGRFGRSAMPLHRTTSKIRFRQSSSRIERMGRQQPTSAHPSNARPAASLPPVHPPRQCLVKPPRSPAPRETVERHKEGSW